MKTKISLLFLGIFLALPLAAKEIPVKVHAHEVVQEKGRSRILEIARADDRFLYVLLDLCDAQGLRCALILEDSQYLFGRNQTSYVLMSADRTVLLELVVPHASSQVFFQDGTPSQ